MGWSFCDDVDMNIIDDIDDIDDRDDIDDIDDDGLENNG